MKKTIMILLVLAMMLTVFAVACGNDAKPAPEDSRTMDDTDDDVEAARGSADTGEFNFDNITLEDWIRIGEPDEGVSYRGTAFDTNNLVSADEK